MTQDSNKSLPLNKTANQANGLIYSDQVQDFPFPTGKEENWRFTPLVKIAELLDPKQYQTNAISVKIKAPQQVAVTQIPTAEANSQTNTVPCDRLSVVAWHKANTVHHISIAEHDIVDEPIYITITGSASQLTAQRVFINLGAQAQATIIIKHQGLGQLNQIVDVNLATEAKLTLASLQEWQDSAIHTSFHNINLAKDAYLKHIIVSFGGSLVRIYSELSPQGNGGTIDAYGLYYADAKQHLEHRISVKHTAPHGTSRVTYKGALQGEQATSVWVGDSLIDIYADATDTYELNRNLVLSKGTKVHSIPNLEIKNGNIIGAGHASATGKFDNEHLFYLMSRGIDASTAKRIVVQGYFAELIKMMDVACLEQHLIDSIEQELNQSET